MRISLIAAMADNRCIGDKGKMPWHLPADLKHFKATTMENPVIMGRKTYESIGKPLPGRLNIIITRNPDYAVPDCLVVHDVETAMLETAEYEEVFIIGGGVLFQQSLMDADRIYMTEVHASIDGDTFFPEFGLDAWHETHRKSHAADENNSYSMDFVIYDRVRN